MMKKIVVFLLLLLIPVTVCAANPKNLDSRQVKDMIAKKQNLFLVDVRTPDEYRQARLRGAINIPLDDFKRRLKEIPKNRPVLVYCAVGVRSASAAGYLSMKGYSEVYHLTEGIIGWYNKGFPVDR